jgi:hypothetical protein
MILLAIVLSISFYKGKTHNGGEIMRCVIETYQSLETQIRKLWASKGLEVIEERVRALKGDKYKWTIIARPKK